MIVLNNSLELTNVDFFMDKISSKDIVNAGLPCLNSCSMRKWFNLSQYLEIFSSV